MNPRGKRYLALAGGLLLSLLAVAYFVVKLRGHWGQFAASFAAARYRWVVPALLLLAAVYGMRVVRWRLFLRPIRKVPYSDVTAATFIGFMASCLLPLRAGEVIRPYVLHRRSGVRFGHAAGTAMGLERLFDLVGSVFLLFLALVLIPETTGPAGPQGAAPVQKRAVSASDAEAASAPAAAEVMRNLRRRGKWLAGATGVGLAGLLALALAPRLVLRPADRLLRRAPQHWREPLRDFLQSIAHSMQFLRKPWQAGAALALSLALWFCFPLSTWCLARAFGLQLPLAGALLVQVILTVAVAAPQGPAFLGVFQVAAMTGAQLFGAAEGEAAAFGMALWGLDVLPVTAVGLLMLWYEGLSLRKLARNSRKVAEQTPAG